MDSETWVMMFGMSGWLVAVMFFLMWLFAIRENSWLEKNYRRYVARARQERCRCGLLTDDE